MINIIPQGEKHKPQPTCKCEPCIEKLPNGEIVILHQTAEGKAILKELKKIVTGFYNKTLKNKNGKEKQ